MVWCPMAEAAVPTPHGVGSTPTSHCRIDRCANWHTVRSSLDRWGFDPTLSTAEGTGVAASTSHKRLDAGSNRPPQLGSPVVEREKTPH